MTLLQSFILGLIQGLTEFIPVSSTAHLLIAQQLLGIPAGDATFAFLVLVQLGTVVSLIVFFWRDLVALLKAFFARPFSTPDNRLAWYIIIAAIPALLVGALFSDAVEALFKIPLLEASIRLLVAAALMAGAEYFGRKNRGIDAMTWPDGLIVGLFQILSVFPGASRSGTTISGGMFRGLDRPSAARFAFLLAVPVMLAAGAFATLHVLEFADLASFLPTLLIGFVTAAIVGLLAIRWLLRYLSHHSLYVFAAYCAVVGAACFIAWIA
jgi:undecaprenyl-diphosphatase